MRRVSTFKWCCLAVILSCAVAFRTALATTYSVNTTNDTHDATPGDDVCQDSSGACSLRAAVEESEAHANRDAILLPANRYVLSLGPLTFSAGDVDIEGAGPTTTIIDGNSTSRLVYLGLAAGHDVSFYSVALQNGRGGDGLAGGAVNVYSGSFYGNDISISNSQVTNAGGGGVATSGYFWCADCTISGNSTSLRVVGGAMYSGGGVMIYDGGEADLIRTTVSGNTAVRGGGIAGGSTLLLLNSTVSGNRAVAGGGGLRTIGSTAQWTIAYSTIANNQANSPGTTVEPNLGGGILHVGGLLRIGKTILAGNSDNRTYNDPNFSPDCATTSTSSYNGPYTVDQYITSYWDNIYGNIGYVCQAYDVNGGNVGAYDGWGGGSDDFVVGLGPLQNNGGNVQTQAPQPGSSAIDWVISGNPSGEWMWDCGDVDATWESRPQGYACDTGSVETHY